MWLLILDFMFQGVTLSINNNIKFSENIKQGFERTISWNKYRSEITRQPKKNNLDYWINSTFRTIYRLFVLSFKNGNNDPARDSFEKILHTISRNQRF